MGVEAHPLATEFLHQGLPIPECTTHKIGSSRANPCLRPQIFFPEQAKSQKFGLSEVVEVREVIPRLHARTHKKGGHR